MPTLSPKAADQRKRLDRFLSEAFPEQSRSQIQKWIDDQQVLLDGKPAKAGYKLRGKEQIEVSLPERNRVLSSRKPFPWRSCMKMPTWRSSISQPGW